MARAGEAAARRREQLAWWDALSHEERECRLSEMTPRQECILRMRGHEGMTWAQIAQRFAVTPDRIRQIAAQALRESRDGKVVKKKLAHRSPKQHPQDAEIVTAWCALTNEERAAKLEQGRVRVGLHGESPLTEREKRVLQRRFQDGAIAATWEEIARTEGCSTSTVAQAAYGALRGMDDYDAWKRGEETI